MSLPRSILCPATHRTYTGAVVRYLSRDEERREKRCAETVTARGQRRAEPMRDAEKSFNSRKRVRYLRVESGVLAARRGRRICQPPPVESPRAAGEARRTGYSAVRRNGRRLFMVNLSQSRISASVWFYAIRWRRRKYRRRFFHFICLFTHGEKQQREIVCRRQGIHSTDATSPARVAFEQETCHGRHRESSSREPKSRGRRYVRGSVPRSNCFRDAMNKRTRE